MSVAVHTIGARAAESHDLLGEPCCDRPPHRHHLRVHLDDTHATLTVARDPAGQVTLVDLRLGPHGSTTSGLADALGSALTLALRAGAPADLLLIPRTATLTRATARRPAVAPPMPALYAALGDAP